MTRFCSQNPAAGVKGEVMEGQERSEDLRASRSWEVVHRMPARADAAQGESQDRQAQERTSSGGEEVPGVCSVELRMHVDSHSPPDGSFACRWSSSKPHQSKLSKDAHDEVGYVMALTARLKLRPPASSG